MLYAILLCCTCPGVHQAKAEQYVDLVMKVGVQLKALLKSVYEIIGKLPQEKHEEVSVTPDPYHL